eukprot:15435617-Alexandrium_andersonii.AAC.1
MARVHSRAGPPEAKRVVLRGLQRGRACDLALASLAHRVHHEPLAPYSHRATWSATHRHKRPMWFLRHPIPPIAPPSQRSHPLPSRPIAPKRNTHDPDHPPPSRPPSAKTTEAPAPMWHRPCSTGRS